MIENEITDGVGALDGELVTVEGVQEPWVVFLDEITRGFVCPEDILAGGGRSFSESGGTTREIPTSLA